MVISEGSLTDLGPPYILLLVGTWKSNILEVKAPPDCR